MGDLYCPDRREPAAGAIVPFSNQVIALVLIVAALVSVVVLQIMRRRGK